MVCQAVNLPHHQEGQNRPLLLAASVTIKLAETVHIKQFKTCYDNEEQTG